MFRADHDWLYNIPRCRIGFDAIEKANLNLDSSRRNLKGLYKGESWNLK
jgi:hypothetical protein